MQQVGCVGVSTFSSCSGLRLFLNSIHTPLSLGIAELKLTTTCFPVRLTHLYYQ